MRVYYRPADGFVGDVIPFYWQGAFHAFYLKAPLPPHRHGADYTPYAHLVSRDLAHWDEWPLVISPGLPGEPDAMGCWTGSVIEREGLFHLFYTGYAGPDAPQTICHAISHDLRTWQKDPRNPVLRADARWYEGKDWRDPFVFWNEEAGEYWMLMAARQKDGPANRRGCIALATSPDLERWEVRPPFWAPSLYYTHECPDLFRWEGRWALVYSTFSERHVTHYRFSDSLAGPWLAPANDVFDTRAFYAAKTASDGQRRFIFGWNPTREGETDTGGWEWGGHMVVHELRPNEDGGFSISAPSAVAGLFKVPMPLTCQPRLGQWQRVGNSFSAGPTDGFAACILGELPETCQVDLTIACTPGTRSCGLLLRAEQSLERYYQFRWEPMRRRMTFDRWPRPGDQPFMLEQPLEIASGEPMRMKVIVEDTVVVAYLNEAIALSTRAYDQRAGALGLFVAEGSATFTGVTVTTIG